MLETIAFLWPEEEFRATGLDNPPGYNIRFGRAGVREEAEAACSGADYILSASGSGLVDSKLLNLAPEALLVQLTGAGYDNVDRKECARRNIPVAYLPGMNAPSVAQTLLQVALRLLRPITCLRDGGTTEWLDARSDNVVGAELSGQVGIVGFGHIGKNAAGLFQGLGLNVVRAAHGKQFDPNVPALPLEELLKTSDIIIVTLPATKSTENFIDHAMVNLMKPTAILLNYGRGGTVNEEAVAAAIKDDRLRGAGFDVFAKEPIPPTHPFLQLPADKRAKVFLTAHVAGQTTDSKKRNFSIALSNVDRVARGEKPLHELRYKDCP